MAKYNIGTGRRKIYSRVRLVPGEGKLPLTIGASMIISDWKP